VTPVLIPVQVGSDEWREARCRGVTASEIAIVAGIAPGEWSSPYDLYHQKAGSIAGQRQNDAMTWGHDLEAAILNRFAREHPDLRVTLGALLHKEDDPRWMATPDGLAWSTRSGGSRQVRRYRTRKTAPAAVVQAKTAGTWDKWGQDGTDDIPVYYRAQVLWEMHVTGARRAYLPVLFPSFGYREYAVDYDQDEVDVLVNAAEEFMDRIARRDPPDIDDRPATTRALQQLHPDRGEGGVEVPETWVRQWQLADRLEDQAGKRKRLAENRLRALVGDNHHATVNGEPLANKVVYDQRRVDVTALRRAEPDVYDRFARPSTVHKFLIQRAKETQHG
jgi:putative phage-type endonuclease